ncbi:hypothetical protein BDV25DRAFT_143342 [Aspergillus avenaceus]|uniref:NAD-dependent epimerase/dehydratase domain-containing protein n=1 Tax=Aspergillus avenaceus TaxID=36643 RepID=A0A5N6TL22_ASPAV|nr:hypothetical protein BDV25DRAFT_143342 [Aspergillus avenaceus]
MTRIFLTGASGYIGGNVLHLLLEKHPEYEVSVLVRDAAKGAKIAEVYPRVRVVQGELDSLAVVEEEARRADVVVHAAASNHIESAEAVFRGLSDPTREKTGYWIQVSGATLLSAPEIEKGVFGEPSEKIYGDIDNEEDIKSIIRQYSAKRVVDSFILNSPSSPKTAVVVPPIIYGQGQGPIKQRSVQIPELARITLQHKTGYQVGRGLSVWSNVHIADISSIFVALVEKAAAGDDGPYWNENGIYLAENGAISFGDISRRVAEEATKLGLSSTDVKEVDHAEADELSPHAGILLGTNARAKAQRARKVLGWTPTGGSLQEEIAETVRIEAVALGLLSKSTL